MFQMHAIYSIAVLNLCSQNGITEVKVEETADGHILHLQTEDALIQLEEDATHIICDNNEPLRTALRDLVLRFLQKLWPLTPALIKLSWKPGSRTTVWGWWTGDESLIFRRCYCLVDIWMEIICVLYHCKITFGINRVFCICSNLCFLSKSSYWNSHSVISILLYLHMWKYHLKFMTNNFRKLCSLL